MLSYWKNKKDEIKYIIQTSPKSYVIYLFSFSIFLFIGVCLFFISQKLFFWYTNKSIFLFIPFVIIAFLLDTKWLIYKIAKTNSGQLIYALMAYIVYAIAEVFSKNTIYTLTSTDPEQYGSALKFMQIIYVLPAWTFVITLLIAVVIALLTAFLFISHIFYTLPFFKGIGDKILFFIQRKFHFQHNIFMHMSFYTISLILFSIIFIYFADGILKLIPEKRIAEIVLSNTSYYRNQADIDKNLTCSKIKRNTYIKLIGDNRASILLIEPNVYGMNFNIDKNISFRIEECN